MFSNYEKLNQRTPKQGIDRREFIQLLADEYVESLNLEAKLEVTANLANFAYDPLNHDFLKESKVHDIFLEALDDVCDKLVLHGIAGICNLCLDPTIKRLLILNTNIERIIQLLWSENPEIILNTLVTLAFLAQPKVDSESLIERLTLLTAFPDQRIRNASVLVLNFYHNLKIGDYIEDKKRLTNEQVTSFSRLTDDVNPIHLPDKDKKCLIHGALLNAIVAGIIGTKLPGPGCMVVSQKLFFPNKCYSEDDIHIRVELVEIRKFLKVVFSCNQHGKVVFHGEAKLYAAQK